MPTPATNTPAEVQTPPPAAETPPTAQSAATPAAPPTPPAAAAPAAGSDDPDWMRKRLEQAQRAGQRKLLQELLGTDDIEVARTRVQALTEAEKTAEEARRAEMSELERAKEDREQALAALQEAQDLLEQQQAQRVVVEAEHALTNIASGYIREDMVDDALDRLQVHCQSLSDDELEEFDPEEWFATLAVAKPAYALDDEEEAADAAADEPEAAAAPPPAPPVKVVRARPEVGHDPSGKTPTQTRPTRSYKDMNNADLNKELARLGLSFRFTERPGQK